MKVVSYISDTNISNMKEKLLYKDKTTLMFIMPKCKIKHSFNFRVKRFDSNMYVILQSYKILHYVDHNTQITCYVQL